MTNTDFMTLGIALGLGLLVGLQRERLHNRIAGIRTFTLLTLFGTLTGMLSRYFNNGWIIAGGGLSVALLFGIANFLKRQDEQPDIGQTTEVAALVMFSIGAYLVVGNQTVGVVMGAVVALLLYLKEYLGKIIDRLGEKDIQAIMVFVAVSLVILPILPDNNFGPYDVLNLRQIWLMVVLIVGISMAGYFAYKWLGNTIGTGLSGILGGLISSTATTVTYSRMSNQVPGTVRLSAFVVTAASTVAFVRILFEVAIVAPQFFNKTAPPLLVVTCFLALASAGLFFYNKNPNQNNIEPDNPAQFKTALVFALAYALILLAVAYVKNEHGRSGLYSITIVSGLTDVDAITLSIANLLNDSRMNPSEGWRLILLAALSNLVFKGGIIAFLGSRKLFRIIAPLIGATLIVGALVFWLWEF